MVFSITAAGLRENAMSELMPTVDPTELSNSNEQVCSLAQGHSVGVALGPFSLPSPLRALYSRVHSTDNQERLHWLPSIWFYKHSITFEHVFFYANCQLSSCFGSVMSAIPLQNFKISARIFLVSHPLASLGKAHLAIREVLPVVVHPQLRTPKLD